MKPKQYLADNGHISPDKVNQRGRLSRDLIAIIEKAVANGAQIDGYSVTETKATATGVTDNPDAPIRVERVKIDPNVISDIGDPIRPESSWSAYAYVDGKKKVIGMRTVDQGCGNSLTYCPCRAPKVFVDHEHTALVNFAPVK